MPIADRQEKSAGANQTSLRRFFNYLNVNDSALLGVVTKQTYPEQPGLHGRRPILAVPKMRQEGPT